MRLDYRIGALHPDRHLGSYTPDPRFTLYPRYWISNYATVL